MKTVLDPTSNLQHRVYSDTPNVGKYLHYIKHKFVIPFIFKKKVLDVGCGTGYGLKILSPFYKSAVGLDDNEMCIKLAKSLKIKNTTFYKTDVQNFNLPDKDFETIISMDVIQQIKNPSDYLSSISNHLVTNGTIIIATPNIEKTKNTNPVHYREYTFEEFKDELENHFVVLDIYAQEKNDKSARLRLLWKFDPFKVRNIIPKKVCDSVRKFFGIPLYRDLSEKHYPITTNVEDAYAFLAICKKTP